MGSKQSKTQNEDINEENSSQNSYILTIENGNKLNNSQENNSNINNITESNNKSTTDNTLTISNVQKKIENNINNINQNYINELIPYKFIYKGNGNNVSIKGNFLNNWETALDMKKNSITGNYEIIVNLEKKIHLFKFIVDNEWIINDYYPTYKDNSNNINNYIDLTNYLPEEITKNIIINNKKSIKNNKKNIELKKNDYNNKYPNINELNTKAPIISNNHKLPFNIDYQSNQNVIKRKECDNFLDYVNDICGYGNDSYKKIIECPNDKLCHACVSIDNLSEYGKKYIKCCINIRNRHKFSTFVYYKAK